MADPRTDQIKRLNPLAYQGPALGLQQLGEVGGQIGGDAPTYTPGALQAQGMNTYMDYTRQNPFAMMGSLPDANWQGWQQAVQNQGVSGFRQYDQTPRDGRDTQLRGEGNYGYLNPTGSSRTLMPASGQESGVRQNFQPEYEQTPGYGSPYRPALKGLKGYR